ncbi:general transcription factor IIIAa [Oncorhynchus nerka]|uniref:general transcription factor IIIAa n=1 Tax=Oncorhynchus nerka TaxID=8023 RepID=UPI001131F993|nr:transcription factor IIIA-like isoform X2 [Oncorhynchus nerka]
MELSQQVPRKSFICSFSDCHASYNKAWKLDAHICKHTGLKPFVCEHDGCDKSFCDKYHLARHQLSHSGERPFRCTVDGCTEAFTTNYNLKKHVNRKHNHDEEKLYEYVCSFEGCGKVFRKNNQLKSHECQQHTKLPPFHCTFEGCEKQFTFPNKLRLHEKVHRGYPCEKDGCSFIGKTWTEYTNHRRDVHRALFQCNECNKVFRDTWFLKQHQRVHAEERQVFICPREGCQRSFTTPFNLQSHIGSFHEELRPYTCPHEGCGKTFAMKQSLQRHSVVHDPERKKQKKPRPKRSLVSRLSGYKPKNNSRPKPHAALQSESIARGGHRMHMAALPYWMTLGLERIPVSTSVALSAPGLCPAVKITKVWNAFGSLRVKKDTCQITL